MRSTRTGKKGCEFIHLGYGPTECTGVGNWLVERHGRTKRICEKAARRIRKDTMAGAICAVCGKPRHTHWWVGGPYELV